MQLSSIVRFDETESYLWARSQNKQVRVIFPKVFSSLGTTEVTLPATYILETLVKIQPLAKLFRSKHLPVYCASCTLITARTSTSVYKVIICIICDLKSCTSATFPPPNHKPPLQPVPLKSNISGHRFSRKTYNVHLLLNYNTYSQPHRTYLAIY